MCIQNQGYPVHTGLSIINRFIFIYRLRVCNQEWKGKIISSNNAFVPERKVLCEIGLIRENNKNNTNGASHTVPHTLVANKDNLCRKKMPVIDFS
ncbi:MAG: hypothetical protein LBS04_05375 [Tannerellaceae bacterium]|jgi:hypothetical protein|nr:hypothetical protein [Tannerellaceae bacterium]